METLQAVVEAAEEERSLVIIASVFFCLIFEIVP
jgi:fructose/tagatose bisphosphate aldolase